MGNGVWTRTKNIVVEAGIAKVNVKSVLKEDLRFMDFEIETWLRSRNYRTIPVRNMRYLKRNLRSDLIHLYYTHKAFLVLEEDDGKIYVASLGNFEEVAVNSAFLVFIMDKKEYKKKFGKIPRIMDTIPEIP